MMSEWILPGAVKDTQSVSAQWDPLGQTLIAGVRVHEVRHVPKASGRLTEIYRRDWLTDTELVDQVFQVELLPGRITAWHAHEQTIDRLFISEGSARIVLYDARQASPTQGTINQFLFGEHRPALVVIPARVWHGVQSIGPGPARILNLVDRAYDYASPDHWRVPADSPHVPFTFPR